MKKLLLASTVLAGVALLASPASAAVKLDLGGFITGYGVWADNDEAAGASVREFDLRRDSEVYVSGETTLDNGLTVGFHTEQDLGGGTVTDEVYTYFSGGWGRLNVGAEDGAAYLLQVAAPSADSNVDGLRTTLQALNPADAVFAGGVMGLTASPTLDYAHEADPTQDGMLAATGPTGATERLSYLTPKWQGFQAGVSYAPETGQNAVGNNLDPMASDAQNDQYEDIWEVGLRWDGEFQGLGIGFGGGYSNADLEVTPVQPVVGAAEDVAPVVADGIDMWNVGLSLGWNGFTLGGSYGINNTENRVGYDAGANAVNTTDTIRTLDVDQTTWVVGLGWDNGPYHLGTSYLRSDIERDGAGIAGTDDGVWRPVDAEVDRFTVGAGYTFGPGMTFRGSVAWGEFDNNSVAAAGGNNQSFDGSNQDFQQVAIGTDIQF